MNYIFEVGEITESLPGTLGIFCYDTEKSIGVTKNDVLCLGFQVFEVRGINKLYTYPKGCEILSEFRYDEYYRELKIFSGGIPKIKVRKDMKIVTFESVEVIRQLTIKDMEDLGIQFLLR